MCCSFRRLKFHSSIYCPLYCCEVRSKQVDIHFATLKEHHPYSFSLPSLHLFQLIHPSSTLPHLLPSLSLSLSFLFGSSSAGNRLGGCDCWCCNHLPRQTRPALHKPDIRCPGMSLSFLNILVVRVICSQIQWNLSEEFLSRKSSSS